jgi:hypothetical protein
VADNNSYVYSTVCRHNQLFFELIGGSRNPPSQASSAGLGLLITYSFDLRKKLKLTQIILKKRDVDESKIFRRLHQLFDLRNVIAHYPFEEELDKKKALLRLHKRIRRYDVSQEASGIGGR